MNTSSHQLKNTYLFLLHFWVGLREDLQILNTFSLIFFETGLQDSPGCLRLCSPAFSSIVVVIPHNPAQPPHLKPTRMGKTTRGWYLWKKKKRNPPLPVHFLKFYLLFKLLQSLCVCIYIYAHMFKPQHTCRGGQRATSGKPAVSFHHVGSRAWTRFGRLDSTCPDPLSHLNNLITLFSSNTVSWQQKPTD